MQRKKQFLLLLSLFFLSSNHVYASCTEEEIDNFKKIEDEYKVTYEFNIESKTYTLTFHEAYPDSYSYALIYDNEAKEPEYVEIDKNTYIIKNIMPGEQQIAIYGMTENCDDELKRITIKLPKYNKYSEDSLCQGIEEFVLCQPTYDKDIDYDTFVSRVNTYKKTLSKEEQNKNEDIKPENKIITYIKENLFQISIVIIFIIVLTITLMMTIKSIRKSRRLE